MGPDKCPGKELDVTRAYLDWNATAPLRAEARAAMVAAMDVVGNPSSVHAEGRTAKGLMERRQGYHELGTTRFSMTRTTC